MTGVCGRTARITIFRNGWEVRKQSESPTHNTCNGGMFKVYIIFAKSYTTSKRGKCTLYYEHIPEPGT